MMAASTANSAKRRAIITGGAGFIGSHLVDRLLAEGNWRVTVIDNFDPSCPRAIKEANIAQHASNADFDLIEGDLLEDAVLERAFLSAKGGMAAPIIVHMAAKAGMRSSMADPIGYHRVNVTGTLKLLEAARKNKVDHFLLASSSSVYGMDPDVPWKEKERGLLPISPYAASKLASEQFAQVYARLHGMKVTVLRLFTVHGPRQGPDQAIHQFFRGISAGLPVQQFGDGSTRRDHTFVDDIINGVRLAIDRTHGEAFEIYNLGTSETTMLRDLITAIEREIGMKAIIHLRPDQPGDVPRTFADVGKAGAHFGYRPFTALPEGLAEFHRWIAMANIPAR